MSIYHCHHCDKNIDSDYHVCEVDPDDDKELICPDCLDEIDGEPGTWWTKVYGSKKREQGD